jgi:hypothetical protein
MPAGGDPTDMTTPHTTQPPIGDGSADGHASAAEPHGAGDHGTDYGHDDHAHLDAPLGPVDVVAWGVGVLGVVIGLAIAACFAFAAS